MSCIVVGLYGLFSAGAIENDYEVFTKAIEKPIRARQNALTGVAASAFGMVIT